MAPRAAIAVAFAPVLARIGGLLSNILLAPGSTFSLMSLAAALAVALAFLRLRRGRRKFPALRILARALFPRRWRGASMRADLGFFLLNSFATAGLVGWGLISYAAVSRAAQASFDTAFGTAIPFHVPALLRDGAMTVALFLAYEFGYWLDHYLKHRVPLLWEFHRVHHTAETLSPLTTFRMHPVDSLIFADILALAIGLTDGAARHLLGAGAQQWGWSGTNAILLVFVFAIVHLQHSHIDMRFSGWLGRLVLSPGHHQIHHSTRPEHFNGNLGSCLAIWDWMFGTLVLPGTRGTPLRFGADVQGDRYAPHTLAGGLALPFMRALKLLAPRRLAPVPSTAHPDSSAPRA
ncbi:MAG: sterol desaturase family protein [Rhizomicrobium sp.]